MPKPVTIKHYKHKRAALTRWKSDAHMRAYLESRNAAVRLGMRADELYSRYLHGRGTDAEDAVLVQASELLDRVSYGLAREACLLWNDGGI